MLLDERTCRVRDALQSLGSGAIRRPDRVTDHLAIIKQRYANLIFSGTKRIECRSGSGARRPPWNVVARGDRIWLKVPAGPIVGVARAGRILEFADLNRDQVQSIRRQYGHEIAAPASFWAARSDARWAVLIWLERTRAVEPFTIEKFDRRGWVVLDGPPKRAHEVPLPT